MRKAADLLRTQHWAATGFLFMLLTALVALHLGLCSPDHHHDHAPVGAAAAHADVSSARHPHESNVGDGSNHGHVFCDVSTAWLAEPRAQAARLAALLALLAAVLLAAGLPAQLMPLRSQWLGFARADRPPLGQARDTLLTLCVSRT